MNSIGVAQQEAVKRQVNEAIEEGLWPDEREDVVRLRCECGSTDCTAFVSIRVGEYERVRQHPRRFILANGHQIPEVEKVIARTPRYQVVEKLGVAGEIAELSDPRSDDQLSDPAADDQLSDPRADDQPPAGQ